MKKYIKLALRLLLPIILSYRMFSYLPTELYFMLVLLIVLCIVNEIVLYFANETSNMDEEKNNKLIKVNEDLIDMNKEILTIAQELEEKNKIYKKHWLDLCNQIIDEVDKDGWCRLVITKEEAIKMKNMF